VFTEEFFLIESEVKDFVAELDGLKKKKLKKKKKKKKNLS